MAVLGVYNVAAVWWQLVRTEMLCGNKTRQ